MNMLLQTSMLGMVYLSPEEKILASRIGNGYGDVD